MVQQANAHWVVWMTLLVGAIFSIMPLPEWLSLVRPAWVPLVVIYWVLALPERFGLLFAFITGLLLDVFQGSLFGLNSLGMMMGCFYCAQPASTAPVISCLATGLYGVPDDWFLSAVAALGSQCSGGYDSFGLVFAAFTFQCAYLAMGYVRAAFSEALFPGDLVLPSNE